MKKLLFICGKNKMRSPTAENIFADYKDIETRSAGIESDAVNILCSEDLLWADIIFLMETSHKIKLLKQYKKYIKNQKVVILNIKDKYKFMDKKLIDILKEKVKTYI